MVFQFRRADLGSLEIAENAQRLALLAANPADHLDQGEFLFVRAVGEIQPNDIDSRAHQVAEDGHRIRRRTESGDYLGAALRDRVVQACFSERHSIWLQDGKAIGNDVFTGYSTSSILHCDTVPPRPLGASRCGCKCCHPFRFKDLTQAKKEEHSPPYVPGGRETEPRSTPLPTAR